MANVLDVQLLEYGTRNVRVKVIGLLDTSDMTVTTFLSPNDVLPFVQEDPLIIRTFRINNARFATSEGLSVLFWWRGTPDQIALTVTGSQQLTNMDLAGGIQNNAQNATGELGVSTRGFVSGALTFTVLLDLVKIGGI